MGSALQPFRFSQHALDLSPEERPLPLRTARTLPVVTSHEPMIARNRNIGHSNRTRAVGWSRQDHRHATAHSRSGPGIVRSAVLRSDRLWDG